MTGTDIGYRKVVRTRLAVQLDGMTPAGRIVIRHEALNIVDQHRLGERHRFETGEAALQRAHHRAEAGCRAAGGGLSSYRSWC
jgi:hypothetical protein